MSSSRPLNTIGHDRIHRRFGVTLWQHLLIFSLLLSLFSKPTTANISLQQKTTNPTKTTKTMATTQEQQLEFLNDLKKRYAHQPTFLQAVEEMAISLLPLFQQDPFYQRAFLAMTEPERSLSFRVPWMDDAGNLCINRGWRVEFSSVLGPYKGVSHYHYELKESDRV